MNIAKFKVSFFVLAIALSIVFGLVACSANTSTPSGQSLDTIPAAGNTASQETVPTSTLSLETEAPVTVPTTFVPTTEAPVTEVPTTEAPTTEIQSTGEFYQISIQFHESTVVNYEMELVQKTEREITLDELPELSDHFYHIAEYMDLSGDTKTYKCIKASFLSKDGAVLDLENIYEGDYYSFDHDGLSLLEFDWKKMMAHDREDFCFIAELLSMPDGKDGGFLHMYCSLAESRILGGGVYFSTTVPYRDGKLLEDIPWDEVKKVDNVIITKLEP